MGGKAENWSPLGMKLVIFKGEKKKPVMPYKGFLGAMPYQVLLPLSNDLIQVTFKITFSAK